MVVLGPTLARRLFPGRASAVGEVLRIDGAAFTVVGVMRPKFQTSWDDAMDADRGVIPHATFRALYGPRTVDGLLVRPTDLARAPAAKQAIYATLGRRYQFDPRDERALDINDAIEDARITEMIGLGIKSFLTLVGVLTLLVAGVGVGNIMFVVVKERTPEIGVKRALGARRPHIMAQFLLEAVCITLAGGGLGVLLSLAVVAGTNAFPIPEGDQTLTFLMRPVLSSTATWVAVASLVAIGAAAGWLPARRAAALEPVESLRYE